MTISAAGANVNYNIHEYAILNRSLVQYVSDFYCPKEINVDYRYRRMINVFRMIFHPNIEILRTSY